MEGIGGCIPSTIPIYFKSYKVMKNIWEVRTKMERKTQAELQMIEKEMVGYLSIT